MIFSELTAKLAALDNSRRTLEGSYERTEFWLFIFTAFVVLGLVIEYRSGLRKLFTEWPVDWTHAATMVGAILVVLGVAGELVTEYKASEFAGGLQALSRQTERLLFSEASDAEEKIADDNKIATNAAKDAANLGVTVGTLHDFVNAKEGELDSQLTALKRFSNDEHRRAAATIAALTRDRADLAQARTDAQAAASSAEIELAAYRKETAPRTINPEQRRQIDAAIKGKVGSVVVQSLPNRGDDTYSYTLDIVDTLKAAGVDAKYAVFSGLFRYLLLRTGDPGLLIDEFGEAAKEPGHILFDAFKAAGISAAEYWEPADNNAPPGVAIIVAPKPPPANAVTPEKRQ